MITVCFTASTDSVKEFSLTINQVAVICTTVTFIVAMVSGCALLMYWVMRKKTVFSPAAVAIQATKNGLFQPICFYSVKDKQM